MSMIAHRIGSVPTEGFDWYIIFLEGPFPDELGEQIDKYFTTLGKEAGERTLVVRGYDPTKFRMSLEAPALYGVGDWKLVDTPALLVTDAVPKPREEELGHNSKEQDEVDPISEPGGAGKCQSDAVSSAPSF
jgi:hypothetical protein